ncbi:hypothetical protein AB4171_08640 [Vibrio sp. 10N.286.51.A4]|uniref:hypothetical protein n=1 Tax=Vibrio sp. 10N.286.51.A4 TaxID=3229705 RepID=UPI0035546370
MIVTLTFNKAYGMGIRSLIYEKELEQLTPYMKCGTDSAKKYKIPEWILLAVLRQESGPLHGYLENSNGSKDYGVGCINDLRIEDFHSDGLTIVTPEKLMEDPCFSIYATAYLIKKEYLKELRIQGKPNENIWLVAAANYHYHYKGNNPQLHEKYKKSIKGHLGRFRKHMARAKKMATKR